MREHGSASSGTSSFDRRGPRRPPSIIPELQVAPAEPALERGTSDAGRGWRNGAAVRRGEGFSKGGSQMRKAGRGRGMRSLAVLIAGLGLAALSVGAAHSADKKAIVIAVPVGLSGVNSVVAPAVVQSGELAVEEINAKGGVLGRKLELVPLDDESGPSGAVKAFNTAIRQHKADAIITMETSAARNAGAPIAERAKTRCHHAAVHEGRACGKYLYVNAWVPEQVVPPLIKYLSDEKKVKKWFAVGSDYAFGRGMIEAAKKTIKGMGGSIVGEEFQPLQQSDWTAIISKIKAANPDGIIYSTSGGGPNIDFMKQFKAAGLTMPVGSLSIDELTAEAGGNAAEGVYYTGDYFTGLDNAENKAFLEAMKKKFGGNLKTPNSLSEPQYDGVYAYAMAIE